MLASRSPQRSAILSQLGVSFEVRIPDVEELSAGPPHEVALENAYRKADAIAQELSDRLVLGVDTLVSLGPRIYGKPPDEAQARTMLRALGGQRHHVISGVCLIERGQARTAAATTAVDFRPLDEALIDWYIAAGEWHGRAGAYAIQSKGAALVSGIDGDYWNVVGLPVALLMDLAPELLTGREFG